MFTSNEYEEEYGLFLYNADVNPGQSAKFRSF